jgi:hypothetical protein
MNNKVLAAAMLLAGCQQQAPDGAKPADLNALLEARDSAACAHPEVEATIRSIGSDAALGLDQDIGLDTELTIVTLESIDEATGRMSCRATWRSVHDGQVLNSVPVSYSIQQDVQKTDVVIYVDDVPTLRQMLAMASYTIRSQGPGPSEDEEGAPVAMLEPALPPAADSGRPPSAPVVEAPAPAVSRPTPQDLREQTLNAEQEANEKRETEAPRTLEY